jgi:hypothetical protein
MIDFLIETALTSREYYVVLGLVSIIYIVCFKNSILHFFDPILTLLLNLIASGTFVTWCWLNDYIEFKYFSVYVFCTIFFIIGTKRIGFKKSKVTKNRSTSGKTPETMENVLLYFKFKILWIFLILISVIHFITIAFVWSSFGLAILSDKSPADARVLINASFRWGFVILEGSRNIGLLSSLFMATYGTKGIKKIVCYLIALGYFLSSASVGSKAAIFNVAYTLGSLLIYVKSIGLPYDKFITWLMRASFGLGFCFFSYALSSANQDGLFASDAFFARIALSGESYVYFFVNKQCEALEYSYNLFVYLAHNLTSPFGIKLVEYNIGAMLYAKSTGDYVSGFGPNPQHVVEGVIFLGLYLAPLYSYAIGTLFSFLRFYFLEKPNNMNFIGFSIFFISSCLVPIDINYSFFNVISSILIVGISYSLALFIHRPIVQETISSKK